jgi:nucleoid-associated protein YgaU
MNKKFMKVARYLLAALVSTSLLACGGGGGNPGTNSGGSGGGTTTPTIALAIIDSGGAVVASNSIGNSAIFYARATLKDGTGNPIANKLVAFTADASVAKLAQSNALTDATGVAKVQISPVGLSAAGAGNLSATATIDGNPLATSLDFQITATNVTVTNMVSSPPTINALQTTSITVEGRVNGVLAGNGVVTVSFSAPCGTFSPTSASTNNAGVATTTYLAAVTCSGPTILSAAAANTNSLPATTIITIAPALPANVVFDSATAPLMVTSTTAGGIKQSTLKFKVLDSTGAGMAGQTVAMDLGVATGAAGVNFLAGSVRTQATQQVVTDSAGVASVIITSGPFPTPVNVAAKLVTAPSIQASSLGVAVTSGRATQNSASIAADKLSLEAANTDGLQSKITMRVADRQGNPVPVGTPVTFIASHGLVQGSCLLDSASQCLVTFTSQGGTAPPINGKAVILAYLDGEESFIDVNGDNVWQPGETFYDVGTLYRDDNLNGVYDAATDQIVPSSQTGAVSCTSSQTNYPSIVNTCDGTWSDSIRVRAQIAIVYATSHAQIILVSGKTASGFSVRVQDLNGNAMPTGTTVAASIASNGAKCTVSSVNPSVVENSIRSSVHSIRLKDDVTAPDCLATAVEVIVTSPSGVSTPARF